MVKNKPILPAKTEFKSFHFERKSIDENQGIITGYLSTFGNVDLQNDRVLKGAFSKTVTEGKSRMQTRGLIWPVLWMHDPEQPIGKVTDAQEDDHGLLITAQLDITTNNAGIPNNPLATMVFSGFKSGFVDELSMGYIAIQKDYEKGVRVLKECAVLEASGVTSLFAANPEALVPASGVKSIMPPEKQKKDFDTLFQATQAADCLEDLGDLMNTFIQATIQAFGMGDQPQEDMQQCVEQFGVAIMSWTVTAIACNLKDYIAQRGYCGDDTPYVPYSMRVGGYDYSSRHDRVSGKVGATISAATQGTLEQHQEDMNDHLSKMADHVKAMQKSMNNLSDMWNKPDSSQQQDGNNKSIRREPLTKSNSMTIDDLAKILV